ncbi:hypothetical protein [Steroidobacter cummioxidans]|uniref:hypothetical protein n=1 Tax=Steroidobacter cummioxidans TaxID=1803913 RepID=UPI000E312240|nr:hypothetical protein [Steroidobacter cummioxidans]
MVLALISMQGDSLYWLFSSSAQAIAALFALLLAAFTLVVGRMDLAEQRDETLVDIHSELKKEYYGELRVLTELTGFAVIFDLALVLLHGTGIAYQQAVVVGVIFLANVSAIVLSVLFLFKVADPQKVGKKSSQLLRGEGLEKSGKDIPIGEFVASFIRLERKLRLLADVDQPNAVSQDFSVSPTRHVSLRQVIRMLVSRGVLSKELAYRLERLSHYRNLVVHGEMDQVDHEQWNQLLSVQTEVDALAVSGGGDER